MKKFVIAPCIGGISLTKQAAIWLDMRMIGKYAMPPSSRLNIKSDGGKEVVTYFDIDQNKDIMLPITTRWYNVYLTYDDGCYRPDEYRTIYGKELPATFDDIADLKSIQSIDTDFRNMLCKPIESLCGLYSELDKLNDGITLRIVNVPDDAVAFVTSSEETGCEWVEERHRMWMSVPDVQEYANIKVRDLLSTIKSVGEYNAPDIKGVFADKYGAIKVRMIMQENGANVTTDNWFYYFLRFEHYYNKADDGYSVMFSGNKFDTTEMFSMTWNDFEDFISVLNRIHDL